MKGVIDVKRVNRAQPTRTARITPPREWGGVSTQLQSSGLVAHENSTFRNLALAVSGPFMA